MSESPDLSSYSNDNEDVSISSSSQSSIKPKLGSTSKWTDAEDDALCRGVQLFGEKNWRNISEFVGTKTNLQCRQRYLKVIAPGIKKGKWSLEEDELLNHVVKLGFKNWREVADKIPGRTSKQCRERWNHYLCPDVIKTPFTTKEDNLLATLYKRYGNHWSKIAKEMPGRTENQVRFRVEHLKLSCQRKDISYSKQDFPTTFEEGKIDYRQQNTGKLSLSLPSRLLGDYKYAECLSPSSVTFVSNFREQKCNVSGDYQQYYNDSQLSEECMYETYYPSIDQLSLNLVNYAMEPSSASLECSFGSSSMDVGLSDEYLHQFLSLMEDDHEPSHSMVLSAS